MAIAVPFRAGALALASLLASPLTAAAGVLVVNAAGGGDYIQISAAVAAASNGDTILVKAGSYGTFAVNGKSLVVMAEEGANVVVDGSVSVQNVPALGQVVISGLQASGASTDGPGLALLANAGSVRVQDGTFEGAANPGHCEEWPLPGDGRSGALVINCADVAFTDCVLIGGKADGGEYGEPCYVGGKGGNGLRAHDSVVALYDSVFEAAQGGYGLTESLGGDGGEGASSQGGRLFASGCTFVGGKGGLGCDFIPIPGYGNGGHGVLVHADSSGGLLDNTCIGGAAGISSFGVPGSPGVPVQAYGPTHAFTGESHVFDAAPAAVREGQFLTLSFTGEPGDLALLLVGLGPDELPLSNVGGVVLLELPLLLGPLPLAGIPGSGTLNLPLIIPSIGPTLNGLPVYMQGLVNEGDKLRLTGGATVVLLDTGS